MTFPKTSKTRAAVVVGIAATSALMIVGPGSTAATAGRLIGSAAIKNNTVRSLDIRNETIRGVDVKDGSLTAKDFSGALRGAPGPRGPAGRRGPAGPAGESVAAAPATAIRTWNVEHTSSPGVFNLTGGDSLPSGTQVEVVKLTVAGDVSSCSSGFRVRVRLGEGRELGSITKNWQGTWDPAILAGGGFITDSPAPVRLDARCLVGTGDIVATPAFDATVTLAVTQRDTTATGSYN